MSVKPSFANHSCHSVSHKILTPTALHIARSNQVAGTGSIASAIVGIALASSLSLSPGVYARDATPYELQTKIQYGVAKETGWVSYYHDHPHAFPDGGEPVVLHWKVHYRWDEWQDRTIRACPSNINPNCVSTASINETYSPAWRATQQDAAAAAKVLTDVVLDKYGDDVRLLSATKLDDVGEYIAFAFSSNFGQDVVEFLIKNESVNNRNWAGDSEGALVTYRSIAGSVKYIWPIQQPISDFGVQRNRVEEIRSAAGWQLIGCELLECYQF